MVAAVGAAEGALYAARAELTAQVIAARRVGLSVPRIAERTDWGRMTVRNALAVAGLR